MSRQSSLALFLSLLFLLPPRVHAQQPPQTGAEPAKPQPAALRKELRVFVLQGDNAINSIPDRKVVIPVVEVRDDNDMPVEGAEVVFQLPASGPGGVFLDKQLTRTVRTNLQGQAAAPYLLNSTPGAFEITVQATTGDRVGRAVISQTNSLQTAEQLESESQKPQGHWYTNWKFLALAGGAAAAVGIVLATRGNGNGSGQTITIRPGSPTFVGPR